MARGCRSSSSSPSESSVCPPISFIMSVPWASYSLSRSSNRLSTGTETARYYTDSWVKEIAIFDYDTVCDRMQLNVLLIVQETGQATKRRRFSHITDATYGEPDGLCMDSQDGIWSARWEAGRVVRFTPEGKVDVVLEFPTAWHVTCVVFGGSLEGGR